MPHKKSREFIQWASELNAFCTKIRQDYENAGELVEDPEWNDDHTPIATSLLKSLKNSIVKIEKEVRSHVEKRY